MMGSGKTTVGALAAGQLNYQLVDMDAEIRGQLGMTIREIFSRRGEAYFRSQESKLLKELAARSRQVVATGGGAMIDPDNRRLARESGMLVYLRAPAEILAERLGGSRDRPLLDEGIPLEKLMEILEQRRAVYELADAQVNVTDLTPEQTAEQVVRIYRDWLRP
jgi:shikimate kinase